MFGIISMEKSLENEEIIFRKLQEHIDHMPVGFPRSKTGLDIKILKQLFTIDEANVALELSMLPESLKRIYPRLKKYGYSMDQAGNILDTMIGKGIIFGRKKKYYSKLQYAIGIFEMQGGRLTRPLAEDCKEYGIRDFKNEFIKKNVPAQIRTIPVGRSIIRENFTDTYDNIRDLIMNTKGDIVIHNCVCREGLDLLGKPCKVSDLRETCIALKGIAKSLIRAGKGRVVTRSEMFALLDEFEKAGFVLQPENCRQPELICCCCGCCCGVITMLKQFPRPADHYTSNYYAAVDTSLCIGCASCEKRCQVNAVSVDAEKAFVDTGRCIGCGLCSSGCPAGAITLQKKARVKVPPPDHKKLYSKILKKKLGTFNYAKVAIKYMLGIKV